MYVIDATQPHFQFRIGRTTFGVDIKIMRNTLLIAAMIIGVLAFNGCKDDDPVPEAKMKVNFNIEHQVNNQVLELDTMKYENQMREQFGVSTLRYFISNIYLITPTDSVEVSPIHFLEIRDQETYQFSNEIKKQEYTGVRMVFGIRKEENITNRFSDPPESLMEWPIPMGGGYHYMKFEGRFIDPQQAISNFQLHTGPTDGNDYSLSYEFPLQISAAGEVNLKLIHHLDHWMGDPNDLTLVDVTRIMGNTAMQEKIMANGHDVFEVELN